MGKILSYRDLEVWQMAMSFAEDVYGCMSQLPKSECYGLADQIRRAVVSVPSNIAEGFGRDSSKDFAHFLSIARGSLYEVNTQLELAVRLGYLKPIDGLNEKATRISKMLVSLAASIRKRSKTTDRQPPTANHRPPTTIYHP